MFGVIGLGFGGLALGWVTPNEIHEPLPPVTTAFLVYVVLRAFASGSSALTGVEAISDGTPAFQPPEAKNAATTLTVMSTLLGIMFLGISFLAVHLGIEPDEAGTETVVSRITELVVPYDRGDVLAAVRREGEVVSEQYEEAGVRVLTDSCSAMSRAVPRGARVAAFDSAKQAHYLPAILNIPVWFGTVEECVEAGLTGNWNGGLK